jgi:hypothetical protein
MITPYLSFSSELDASLCLTRNQTMQCFLSLPTKMYYLLFVNIATVDKSLTVDSANSLPRYSCLGGGRDFLPRVRARMAGIYPPNTFNLYPTSSTHRQCLAFFHRASARQCVSAASFGRRPYLLLLSLHSNNNACSIHICRHAARPLPSTS